MVWRSKLTLLQPRWPVACDPSVWCVCVCVYLSCVCVSCACVCVLWMTECLWCLTELHSIWIPVDDLVLIIAKTKHQSDWVFLVAILRQDEEEWCLLVIPTSCCVWLCSMDSRRTTCLCYYRYLLFCRLDQSNFLLGSVKCMWCVRVLDVEQGGRKT